MADRTSARLIIHDCPADQVRAVLDVIRNYDLTDEGQPKDDRITLGESWSAYEISCGSASEIDSALQATAPGASWTVWEDPAYEWLGDIYRYVSGLGSWSAQCNADGEPVFTRRAVRDAMTEGVLAHLFGDVWTEAIQTLTKQRSEETVTATPEGDESANSEPVDENGDTRFYLMDIDDPDTPNSNVTGWVGVVDEREGGIVAYASTDSRAEIIRQALIAQPDYE